MEMDSRKQKILEAVVLDYIETAEPVGSRTISKKYNLGVSSATIRNEMADLEEMGLIEQPHTSAGRVPSDAGYRYYVDYLMAQSDIQEEAKQLISRAVQDKQQQVGDVLRDSMKMLAEVTHCTTVMMLDENKGSTLKLLQLLPVEPGKALMVIITEGDQIENRFLEVPKTMTKEDLELVSVMMNQNLRGLKVDDWQHNILENIFQNLTHQRQVVDCALEMLSSILDIQNKDKKIYLDGGLNMLSQPEFKDVNKVKSLLHSLEQQEVVTQLMEADNETGITVKIGAENELDEVKDCSVIVANYKVKGEIVGKVGLIGPTRMDYATAVSMLNAMAKTLEEAYQEKE
jgi:heat-inducible transcriptional repressor